jgi:hypothetical protein
MYVYMKKMRAQFVAEQSEQTWSATHSVWNLPLGWRIRLRQPSTALDVHLSSKMYDRMTCIAKCDQILVRVAPRVAAKFLVMHFHVRHGSARLAPPPIAAEDLLTKLFVRFPVEPRATVFCRNSIHELFVVVPCRNSCFCSPDRNLKNLVIENSSVSGSPLSKLAPARKSAQIISRQ